MAKINVVLIKEYLNSSDWAVGLQWGDKNY